MRRTLSTEHCSCLGSKQGEWGEFFSDQVTALLEAEVPACTAARTRPRPRWHCSPHAGPALDRRRSAAAMSYGSGSRRAEVRRYCPPLVRAVHHRGLQAGIHQPAEAQEIGCYACRTLHPRCARR